jgi:outer membrane protein assembly factor BamB
LLPKRAVFAVAACIALVLVPLLPASAQADPSSSTQNGSGWPMFGFNRRHTSTSTTEDILGTGNVSSLALVWSRATGGQDRCCGSPIVSSDGTVLISGGDYSLHAFDAASGAARWTTSQQVYSFSATISGDLVYVGLSSGAAAFHLSNGHVAWSNEGCDGQGIAAPPIVVDGTYYGALNDPALSALDAQTGACQWQGLRHMSTDQFSSPSVAAGRLYVGDTSGRLWCADANDGHAFWHAAAAGQYSAADVSTAAATRKRVYASAGDAVGAYKTSTGVRIWALGFGGNALFGPPALSHRIVYVGSSDGNVYALGKEGQPRWETSVGAALRPYVSVANGIVYVATDKLYALDARRGAILWSGAIGRMGAEGSAPAIANGMVYVEGLNGRLYAFGLPG